MKPFLKCVYNTFLFLYVFDFNQIDRVSDQCIQFVFAHFALNITPLIKSSRDQVIWFAIKALAAYLIIGKFESRLSKLVT